MWPRMSPLSHQHLLVPQYTKKPLLEEKTCYCQRRVCWQYCRSDGYWVEHHDCKKKSIFSYHVCSTLMRIWFSSYQEVKSVVLHALNRARFTVAVDSFLKTGRVPTLQEGNAMENVFNLPWSKHSPIALGPRFKDAFQDVNSYFAMEPVFERERDVS